jgi:hypothetical protein
VVLVTQREREKLLENSQKECKTIHRGVESGGGLVARCTQVRISTKY